MCDFAKGKSAYVFTTEEAKIILGLGHLDNKTFISRLRKADTDAYSKKGKNGYVMYSYNGLRSYHDLRVRNSNGQYNYSFNTPQWVMDRIKDAGSESAPETRKPESLDWADIAKNLAKFTGKTEDEVLKNALILYGAKVSEDAREKLRKEKEQALARIAEKEEALKGFLFGRS